MKFLLALVAVACFVGVYGEPTNLHSADEVECGKKHNVDPEQMAHMHNTPDMVPTRDMKCFAACVMKKSGLMGEDGKFTENFNKKPEMAMCPPKYGADECETVGNLMKCLYKRP